MIRETIQADRNAMLRMITDSGQFDESGLAHVEEKLSIYLAGETDDLWLTADDGEPVGVAYCAPEPVTSGTWNLLMLWTRQDRENQGYGSQLVRRVEQILTDRQARLLIVETSGLPEFEKARAFYDKIGFVREAQIKNFFAAGDDKIIYTKQLQMNDAGG